ncbi:MerR family transcriptional regulator [Galbitalea sp. SE-J8]|uniref:MerR family transcriptional regulator n=1 Tax=Galbitalea sp. SE-J8 TaxID=3054952 RepID=UPI00259CD1E2|nr:MerR family transcriptional regulator [Galbitalea sp. SE-J8]MDM4761719.1 MerR family transcriptional regulator [Galbitalea sp. SE-J8]
MATDALIGRLFDAVGDAGSASVIEALHALLDDSTIEPDAPPRTIAEAAEISGLSPHTLRYYEREGLVRPHRTESGYRAYSAFDLRRLVFLTRMRVSGMTMHDLKHYIALVDAGPATEPARREMMIAQRERIRRQLRELTLALETTEFKIRRYGGHPDG